MNFVEGVPSAAAWARAVPAVRRCGRGSSRRRGHSAGRIDEPRLDIAQLQSAADVRETAVSGRFDVKMNNRWSTYVRVFHDQGKTTARRRDGRVVHIDGQPEQRGLQPAGRSVGSDDNEFKFGYNAAPTKLPAPPRTSGILPR